MILLWHFYWPVVAAGLLIGFLVGKRTFHREQAKPGPHPRRDRNLTLAAGGGIALVVATLWHGPFGAGGRLAANVETNARTTLGYYEMEVVNVRLQRSPLSRRLILSGPSDDVQQRELKRIMDQLPGVSDVRWANPPTAPVMMK